VGLGGFGRYGGIERSEIMTVITTHDLPVTFGETVTGLDWDASGVNVTLTGKDRVTTARFDLVSAADGLNSHTRGLVLGADKVDAFDTGRGGLVAWANQDPGESGRHAETTAGSAAFTGWLRRRLRNGDPVVTLGALDAIEHANDPYLWRFTDTRVGRWATGRVVLVGDAAAEFLPTTGIGATMAMDSAAILAAHLSNAFPEEKGDRYREYGRLQRPRVIAAHENSRQLAKLMFRQ
jgi:salicylate hydroxylase